MAGNYYYVKSPGSGSPSGGTQETGAWPAAYYANIKAAITGGAGAGDFICCSSSHSHTYTSGLVSFSGPAISGAALTVISVDDTDADAYLKGASETAATAAVDDIAFAGHITNIGMEYNSADEINVTAGDNDRTMFVGCDLNLPAWSANRVMLLGDGSSATLIDCAVDLNDASCFFGGVGGSSLEMYGGSVSFSEGGTGLQLIGSNSTAGGYSMLFKAVDLSSISGGSSYLFADIGESTSHDRTQLYIDGCKISASLTSYVQKTDFYNRCMEFHGVRSSSSSAAAEYQYYYQNVSGAVEDATNIYRDSSVAFPDSSQKVSLKAVTTASATMGAPFIFDFPTRYAELSSASTDEIVVYLLSSSTLTDADVWVDVYYPDGTNKQTWNAAHSVSDAFVPWRTGGALTTNSDVWTGRTSENRYQITVGTSGDAGADTVPMIRVYVAKASATVYFDTTIDLA